MTKKIKATKQELLAEIKSLENTIIDKNNELYDAGIKERPTLMTSIIKLEEEALRTIYYVKQQCEKETGRTLSLAGLN